MHFPCGLRTLWSRVNRSNFFNYRITENNWQIKWNNVSINYNTFCISIDLSFSYTYVPLPESASSPDDLNEPPGAATTPELSEVSVSPKKIIT